MTTVENTQVDYVHCLKICTCMIAMFLTVAIIHRDADKTNKMKLVVDPLPTTK